MRYDLTLCTTNTVTSLQGFSVDGTIYDGKDGKKSSFVDKCVRIDGRGRHSKEKPLEGFVMKGMTIRNCG